MPKKIVIIGTGDHGRGTLEIFREVRRYEGSCEILGFLDECTRRHGDAIAGVPVLGGLDWIRSADRAEVGYIIGIADGRTKQRIVQSLESDSLTFVSAIHPSVILAGDVRVAPGAIINAGVAIAYDTLIEEHTTINLNATLGHDCVLGRFSTVAPGANIAGRVRVGEGCNIGPNATIGKGLDVGEWSSIGPGTVVIKNVLRGQSVFGNPARTVHPVTTESPAHASGITR
jgi:sugar O-acyltransferase (sialic acid O-acetyltransferase NeuD family)